MKRTQARELTARSHVVTFALLLALAGLSFGLSYLRLGAFEIPVALTIALAKAALIATVFMHLLEEPASRLLALAGALFMIVLLSTLAVIDVLTRA